VARISEELGIHVVTLYNGGRPGGLQGEVVPARERSEGLGATDKFTVVWDCRLDATEFSAYCRERGLRLIRASTRSSTRVRVGGELKAASHRWQPEQVENPGDAGCGRG